MEYGTRNLQTEGRFSGDSWFTGRYPFSPQMLPNAAFVLNSLQRPPNVAPLSLTETGGLYDAMELVWKPSKKLDSSEKGSHQSLISLKSEDNEKNIEKNDEDVNDFENHVQSIYSCLAKELTMPVLNGWVLGAYTSMLGRLSAATAALEATEGSNLPSDSDSESDHSSYTEESRESSPSTGLRHSYAYGTYSLDSPTRPSVKKHPKRRTSLSGTDNSNNERTSTDLENQGDDNQGIIATGKKRSLALQRVRYRYEREEYRCSLCSYACTIEKAFQRHLRAHARGTASETRVSCAVCGADRSSEVDLSRHMRRHRDNRYFCCDICIFRTVQLKKLIQHRRMHTGEKPHLCPHCAYRSARRDNLRSHVRRVHKKENLYCDTFSPRGMFMTPTTVREDLETDQDPPASPSSNADSDN